MSREAFWKPIGSMKHHTDGQINTWSFIEGPALTWFRMSSMPATVGRATPYTNSPGTCLKFGAPWMTCGIVSFWMFGKWSSFRMVYCSSTCPDRSAMSWQMGSLSISRLSFPGKNPRRSMVGLVLADPQSNSTVHIHNQLFTAFTSRGTCIASVQRQPQEPTTRASSLFCFIHYDRLVKFKSWQWISAKQSTQDTAPKTHVNRKVRLTRIIPLAWFTHCTGQDLDSTIPEHKHKHKQVK